MKEGNSPVSEDGRTRSNGLELRKQEHGVGSREQLLALASAVPDESTAGRRNRSPSPGSRARCPHTCTRCSRDCCSQPQPPAWAAPTVCMDPQVSSQTRSDCRVEASINPAPLPWAEEGHCASPWLYFTLYPGMFLVLQSCYKGWFCTFCKGWTKLKSQY